MYELYLYYVCVVLIMGVCVLYFIDEQGLKESFTNADQRVKSTRLHTFEDFNIKEGGKSAIADGDPSVKQCKLCMDAYCRCMYCYVYGMYVL